MKSAEELIQDQVNAEMKFQQDADLLNQRGSSITPNEVRAKPPIPEKIKAIARQGKT